MEGTGKYRSGSVQDSVYVNLRKNIINLNLAPGTGISEKEIALRYKVSRTPVRETFIHLAKEGLLQVVPQKETLVSRINFSRVEQESFLRESLEMAVLEPFISKSKPEHFAALKQLIREQREAIKNDDYITFVTHDDAFHHALFSIAGQELSWAVLEQMSGHYHRIRLLTVRFKGIAAGIVEQHKNLLGALQKGDLPTAGALLKQHLHKLGDEKNLLIEEFPDYFVSEEGGNAFDVDFGALP
ncbi:GntR family transcriptional regulator [Treponema primitia]|uniref:GntR family transcriptional regulator n=1 Tax=Treponema primitia TaxID=88058 RepID=UPI00397FD0BD